MSQILAVEWNSSEARIALGSMHGSRAVIEQAFSVELRNRSAEGEEPAEVDIGGRLAAALAARGIGKMDALVAIGRTNIELRQFTLPPAPDDDLPEMVRMQALREFNELDDDWLLDFVPLTTSPEEPRSVLAAAIGPDLVAQINKISTTAGVRPKRLVLRASAAASLFSRSPLCQQGKLQLLIDLLPDEADLTVMSDGRAVFMRTMRLVGDPPPVQVLMGEIRRTLAAVQNQFAGRKVESIILCGQGDKQTTLAERIGSDLGITTELFDPFSGVKLGSTLEGSLPDYHGRYAPLIGMLLTELEEKGHDVDFLHPRRRPEPPARLPRYTWPVAAAAVLLLGYFGYQFWCRMDLQDQIASLKIQVQQKTEESEKAKETQKIVDSVSVWAASDINWLDQLQDLSKDIPPAKDIRFTKVTINSKPTGGELKFEGLALSDESKKKLEESLDRPDRKVSVVHSNDDKRPPYSIFFKGSLMVPSEPMLHNDTAKKTPEATEKKSK